MGRRDVPYRYTGKGPGGRNRCRWCGTEVSGRRRTWCSDECVRQYRIRAWPQARRSFVWERDGGICAGCGIDLGAVERRKDRLRRICNRYHHRRCAAREGGGRYGYRDEWCSCGNTDRERRRAQLERKWWRKQADSRGHTWECDHIVPISEGGSHEPTNLQILCLRCHKAKTARGAARRARKRKLREGKGEQGVLFE